ncbi:osmoprotectant transport system permease protein [Kibdelosporangium banguiense]|uniref:Osmoprotectant transport system permease protein n=1 Tax=Kibdelosporangium banguiense TaxID=1365924 RepID=A0ABS4TG08_9PSEU|nr:ABC transporter permease [Kibdelosporangium banguiense]MBP2322914.1 osmoprotectant transport system permease protein [Kibdelosporangium banguiense]
MNNFGNAFAWLFEPAQWSGSTGIPTRILEHLGYTGLAVLLGLVIAVPIGALIGHTGKAGILVGAVNGLRAIPELGLLILLVLLMGIGLLPVTLALIVLAIPPILAGTYAGIRNVDRSVVDAARGMGMREGRILWSVELPNALPLILGGVRAAALQVLATATIAAYVSLGGLGRYVIDGLYIRDFSQALGGTYVIAALALVVEGLLIGLQWLVVSRGLRRNPTRRRDRKVRPVDVAIETA